VDRALELVADSQLGDVTVRQELAQGGQAAIDASTDPMIALAKLVDAESRTVRQALETKVTEPKTELYSEIANAQFAIQGTSTYPDATFSLRLAFGQIQGFQQDGAEVNPVTTIGGAFQAETEHQAEGAWALPQTWHDAQAQLDMTTPLNFASSADIIGGNSGSPVVNSQGELVGLIFDGNRFSFEGAFLYRSEENRAVAVHTAAMQEALRKVYGAGPLADELGKPAGPRSPQPAPAPARGGIVSWIKKHLL
jgi:hypothetical protein